MSNNISKERIIQKITEYAVEAMIYEVSCYPSYGLVSPVSQGAHSDMDYYTFIKSTMSLIKYIERFVDAGYSNDHLSDIFNELRVIGKEAEKEMFKKTKGINTQKGQIFLIGICGACVAKSIYDTGDIEKTQEYIMDMTKGLVSNELKNVATKNIEDMTYGEKLYVKYGCEGIRGEVEKGLPSVFNYGLNAYEKSNCLPQRERLIYTLTEIMQYAEDSTVLHRHDIEVLYYVQNKAKEVQSIGGITTQKGREMIEKLDGEFSAKRISPGGSADLLVITVFLSLIRENFKELY